MACARRSDDRKSKEIKGLWADVIVRPIYIKIEKKKKINKYFGFRSKSVDKAELVE